MLNNSWRAAALVALLACPALALGQRAKPAKAASPLATPAVAQLAPPAEAEEKIYTYVEVMPALPGEVKDRTAGASQHALTQELERRLVVPGGTAGGVVFVEFVVQPTGIIKNARIFRSLNPVADAAALQAIGQLPTLQPGKQNGRLVTVSYILGLKVASR